MGAEGREPYRSGICVKARPSLRGHSHEGVVTCPVVRRGFVEARRQAVQSAKAQADKNGISTKAWSGFR